MTRATERVAAVEAHDEVEALVEDSRKRPSRIERRRAQERHDLCSEVLLEPSSLRGRPIVASTNRMPASRSAGINSSLSTRYCSVTSEFASSVTVRSTSAGAQIVGTRRGRVDGEAVLQTRHANLEELVEIRRRDAEELQPLEQRDARIHRLLEHAQIERELRQLAVDVVVGKFEIQRVHRVGADVSELLTAPKANYTLDGPRRRPGRSSHRSVRVSCAASVGVVVGCACADAAAAGVG